MKVLEVQALAPSSVAMCALLIVFVVQLSSLGPSLKATAIDPAQAVKRR
jgi:ABC-type lipoprotein release transport system permease subunit